MKKAKAERLRKEGWKLGTIQEFLGLSDEEAVLIEMKLAMARRLRQRRSDRKRTQ